MADLLDHTQHTQPRAVNPSTTFVQRPLLQCLSVTNNLLILNYQSL